MGESTGDGGSGGDGGPGLEADLHHFHFHIQIQFGPTDSCITWTVRDYSIIAIITTEKIYIFWTFSIPRLLKHLC